MQQSETKCTSLFRCGLGSRFGHMQGGLLQDDASRDEDADV